MEMNTGSAIFAVGLGFLVQGIAWMMKLDRFIEVLERIADVAENVAAAENLEEK